MNPLSGIQKALRRRYRRWIDRRTRVESECRLDHRRLYILPSKAGFGFLVLVVALWLLATNFENNLIFMLCFLLVGSVRGEHSLHPWHALRIADQAGSRPVRLQG